MLDPFHIGDEDGLRCPNIILDISTDRGSSADFLRVKQQAECSPKLVVKDEKEGECKVLPGQEDDACDSFCDVCEISCGVITENEWKEAVKDDVELTEGEICGILPPLPRAAGLHGDTECVDLERSPRRARESEDDG
ncbi:hypothetical protein NDU88_002796 [Pleurodeles waltl]|uniref:Uncharacterized protein n=1 Tax=Pleurodeles waltl TaxID=8319 RepID=A0AAV7VCC0_PLEWA|nr:hypothetical protein NDU88_002796 [Pleurodeles waltl]